MFFAALAMDILEKERYNTKKCCFYDCILRYKMEYYFIRNREVIMEYKGKKIYTEEPQTGDRYRQNYESGLQKYIEKLNQKGAQVRKEFMPPETFPQKIEEYRREYLTMLGIDGMDISAPERYECEEIGEDEMGKIYRYALYVTEEIPFYGILFVPHERPQKAPLVIAQHGGSGTPELAADMLGRNNYNHMIHRVLERGAIVFAPQLLLWRFKDDKCLTQRQHNIPYDRKIMDASLKRFGLSITGLEIAFIRKAISFFSHMEGVDPERIGMLGLSYGGYFTLHTMAADTRIKVGYSNACFNDRDHYTRFTDWSYKDAGYRFQDAEVAALCAPRKLFLSVGTADTVFDYRHAIPEAERVKDYFKAFEKEENLIFTVWEGGHTVNDSDEGYDFLFDALNG